MAVPSRPSERAPAAWHQVPLPSIERSEHSPVVAVALMASLAAVGPVARAWAIPAGRPGAVAAGALAASVALAFTGGRRAWWTRLTIIAVAAGAMVPIEGRLVGIWLAVGLGVSSWITLGRAPLPRLPPAGWSSIPPSAVILGVAAWTGSDIDATWVPLAIACLAAIPPAASTLGGGWLERTSARIGHVAATAVSAISFAVLSFFAILLPWASARITRFDPLGGAPRRWLVRERWPSLPRAMWAVEAVAVPRGSAQRIRSALGGALSAAVVVGLGFAAIAAAQSIATVDAAPPSERGFTLAPEGARITAGTEATDEATDDEATDQEASGPPLSGDGRPAAYAGEEWYGEYLADFGWLFREEVAWRPLDQYRLRDVTTRHVTIADRERRSWTPPPCACRRLTVWLYGGSAAFGLGQRDEQTIASHLARLAHAEGMALEVSNRGMPGDLHWNAAQRFAWDLIEDPAPDLVLFYDGANELWGAHNLNQGEVGDIARPIDPLVDDIWRELDRVPDEPPPGPEGAEYFGDPSAEPLTTTEVGTLAADRYDRSRKLSRDVATANDVPIRWYWQPSRLDRPLVEAEPHGDESTEAYLREFYGSAAAALPDDVVDLSDVFSGTRAPLFSDEVHHNEEGARLVALALYRTLEAELRRLEAAS